MGKASRDKGANGERELVRIVRAAGLGSERTAQLQAGNLDYGDVTIDGLPFETKRCQQLRMAEWLRKAQRIAFRRNNEEWHVVIPLDEYLALRSAWRRLV